MKKILALIAVLLALGLVAYLYFEQELPSNTDISIEHAIPAQFPLAMESENWEALFEKIDTFKYGAIFNEQDWLIGTKVNLSYVNKILAGMPAAHSGSMNSKTLIAFGNAGNSQLGIILVKEIGAKVSYNVLEDMLKSAMIPFETYSFQNETLYTLKSYEGFNEATVSIKNGLLLFSLQASFVEESLLAIESKKQDWGSLTQPLDNKEDLRLFIKPNELNFLSSYFLKSASYSLIDVLKAISDVSVFQVNFFKDELSFNGYAHSGNATLLDTLKTNISVDNDLLSLLPSNTAFYKMMGFSNQQDKQSTDLQLKTVLSVFDEALVLFNLESFNESIEERKGALVSLESKEFQSVFERLDSSFTLFKEQEGVIYYKANKLADLLNQVFLSSSYFKGELYFTQMNDVLVMSEQIGVLEQFVYAQQEANTLKTNQRYTDFKALMSSKTILDIYTDFTLMPAYLLSISTENTWQSSLEKLNVQYTNIGNQIYCNGKLSFQQKESSVSKALWSFHLDSMSILKPQIVKNHNNGALEVLVQDLSYQFYLLNASGEQQWKISLPEAIIGEVQQIDYYENKKLQYIFNTDREIYIVDRNGDYVDGFPIDLPAKATNGLLLVNYGNSGVYRYMIACDNNNVYGYEQNGSPLPGWSPKKDVGRVINALQYIVKDNKDYLYFSNDEGVFYALNRKGEDRFKPLQTANISGNYSFDENTFIGGYRGGVYEIDLLGNLKTKTILDSSFVYCEVHASIIQNSKAYAFASGNSFKFQQSQWKNFASFKTSGDIVKIESFVNKNKLWFVLYTKDQVYLVDELGTLHPDFPIQTKIDIRISNLIQGKDRVLLYNDLNGNLVAKEIAW